MAENQPTTSLTSVPEIAYSIPDGSPYPHWLYHINTEIGLQLEESSCGNESPSPVNERMKTIICDSGSERIVEDEEDTIPRIGMMFDNLVVAWEYWKKYGESMGFGVRRAGFKRSKKDKVVISAAYVCYREGKRKEDKRKISDFHRWEIRTQCQVKMTVFLDREIQKFKVREFIEEHNHPLDRPKASHMLRSRRKVSESDELRMASDARFTSRATHELCKELRCMGKQRSIIGGNSSLQSKRKRNMVYGELGNIMKYLEERKMKDCGFFYSMRFDSDELLTNIFWADSKMIVDYIDFGDVLTLDTTYGTDNEVRPFGAFVGFNHHRNMVIFGGALMYDQSEASFVWLFETFMKAHNGKRPQTIFTDLNTAMIIALESLWPDTQHGLCTWHLYQNGLENMGWRMKEGSAFFKDFKKCMFEYFEEVQFEMEWGNLLKRYDVEDNDWVLMMYRLKEKWAKCYMKYVFTLGMRSIQLGESLNMILKDYLKCDVNIAHFFRILDRVIEHKRDKELEVECRSRERGLMSQFLASPLLEQASQRYTDSLFEIFESEFRLALRVMVQKMDETRTPLEYVVCFHDSKDKVFKVLYDPRLELLNCSCRMFDHVGVLCCHALKIFIRHDVMDIPEKYMLPRWTRGYRSAHLLTKLSQDVEGDANQWVKKIQFQLFSMTHQACTHEVTRRLVEKMIMECDKEMFEVAMKKY